MKKHEPRLILAILLVSLNICLGDIEKADIEKSTSKLASDLKNEKNLTTQTLSNILKHRNLYDIAHLHFGSWHGKRYLNTLPFDLADNRRYFIIRFKSNGMLSSMLFEIEWDERRKGKYQEMLWIHSSFYTDDPDGFPITRFWDSPWDNDGKLLIKDGRTKKQDPRFYWEPSK